jgi:hypothetical protein
MTDVHGWKKAHDTDSAPMSFESENADNGGEKVNFRPDTCGTNENTCDVTIHTLSTGLKVPAASQSDLNKFLQQLELQLVKNRIYYDWDFAPMSFVFEDTDNSGEN